MSISLGSFHLYNEYYSIYAMGKLQRCIKIRKMASWSASAFAFLLMILVLISIADAQTALPPPRFFNVLSYGAVPDGRVDNSQAFLKAWNDACQWRKRSVVVIPYGNYMLNSLTFEGPCRSEMVLLIKGVLKATIYPSSFFTNTWIGFRYINGLVIKGRGILDGQGAAAWPYNDCFRNPHCMPLPVTMRFDFVSNARVHHLRSVNSKNAHFNLFACNNMNISHIRMSAPANSPNTDGIRIGSSTNIRISHSIIGTGDDCISMVSGSQNIDISDVFCGPGHGISIGSLGNNYGKEFVMGVNVRNCTFFNTQNGVRIKTRPSSFPSFAADISFAGITMDNVNNPIIIDQQYCPAPPCYDENQSSEGVQINDVTFENIWGTSSSEVAITLNCSTTVPCQNVKLVNIDLAYQGPGRKATASCSNVKGASYGRQMPPGCV